MRTGYPTLLVSSLLCLTACSTTSYTLRFRAHQDLNPNSVGQPNTVTVKAMQLKAEGVAEFEKCDFAAIWVWDKNEALRAGTVGAPIELPIARGSEPALEDGINVIKFDKVPEGVTHFGIVALFNSPQGDRNKLLLERAAAPGVEIHLYDKVLEARPEGAPKGPVQPAAPDGRDS